MPAFVDGHGWAFAGKVDEPSAAPLGFEQEPARALVPLTGFYLFTAVWPKQESGSLEPMRLAGLNAAGKAPPHTLWIFCFDPNPLFLKGRQGRHEGKSSVEV